MVNGYFKRAYAERQRGPMTPVEFTERLQVYLDAVIDGDEAISHAEDAVGLCIVAAGSFKIGDIPHRLMEGVARKLVDAYPAFQDMLPLTADQIGFRLRALGSLVANLAGERGLASDEVLDCMDWSLILLREIQIAIAWERMSQRGHPYKQMLIRETSDYQPPRLN